MKVLVFIDQREAKIKSVSYEALSLANQLAGGASNVAAVIVGDNIAAVAEQIKGYGADTVYVASHASLKTYNSLAYGKAVSNAIETFKPDLVLAGATPMGREMMPRLAARFNGGMLTDVIELTASGTTLTAKKPMYAGKCFAKLQLTLNSVGFVSIRPNVFPATKSNQGVAQVQNLPSDGLVDSRFQTLDIRKGKSEKPDLTEATHIISGGRSLASLENFKILFDCADVIGASVGASRAAVDAGYAGHDMQVGQTGKTVNPNLYIACGISGSIQHMAGMRSSKVIVAVNTDPEAPIYSIADYGIVADLFDVVPKLTAQFKRMME